MENLEIEHKFLINDFEKAKENAFKSVNIVQAYLSKNSLNTIRIRITEESNNIYSEIGIKSKKKFSIRKEYEHKIPLESAKEQCETLAIGIVYKTRYYVKYKGYIWEIDEYHGVNKGIIVAEIELNSEEDKYEIPSFVGENITNNKEYSNSTLSFKEPKINNNKYISDFKSFIKYSSKKKYYQK